MNKHTIGANVPGILILLAFCLLFGCKQERSVTETTSPPTENSAPVPNYSIRGSGKNLDDEQVVINRILNTLVEREADIATAVDLASRLDEQGNWNDYTFSPTAVRQSAVHMERVRKMAVSSLAARRQGDEEKARALREASLRALRYWIRKHPDIQHKYVKLIKQPRDTAAVALILQDGLTAEDIRLVEEMVRPADFRVERVMNTSQNKIWRCEAMIMLGLLLDDLDLVNYMLRTFSQEMRMTTREGVQHDYSFQMHGPLLATLSYGQGLPRWSGMWFVWTQGTRYAFPDASVSLIEDYMLNHQQWLIWGGAVDLNARGRSIARNTGAALMDAPLNFMLQVETPRHGELVDFRKRMNNEASPNEPALVGNRMFWVSDIMVNREQDWYASVRLNSSRTLSTDKAHNGESTKGHHLGDGMTMLMRDGTEYFTNSVSIAPLWNWQQLPGTTIVQDGKLPLDNKVISRKGKTRFVGGVSTGESGLFAADFKRGDLSARKGWFFPDGLMVALGTGINYTGDDPVYTTINQCYANGDVTVDTETVEAAEPVTLPQGGVIEQGALSYSLLPENDPVRYFSEQRSSSWREISQVQSDTPVSGEIFTLWIDHGSHPGNSQYAYAVRPSGPGTAAENLFDEQVDIIANTPALQAVWLSQKRWVGAAFYEPGELEAADFPLRIKTDIACAIIARIDENENVHLWVADPSQRQKRLILEMTWQNETLKRTVELPQAPYAGSTVQVGSFFTAEKQQ